jgi:hypothetical protein
MMIFGVDVSSVDLPAAVSYSVQRGEKAAKEKDYQLELSKF